VSYLPEHAAYGGPRTTRAAERHFTDSSRITLALLRGDLPEGVRIGFAVRALMLAFAAWQPDRDAVASFLAASRDGWDAPSYWRQRAVLADQAERCWNADFRDRGGPAGAWWRSIDRLHRQVRQAQADGEYHPVRRRSVFLPGSSRDGDVLLLLLRCVHLLCNRLGISVSQERQLHLLVGITLCEKPS
jgi:thiopeptide-type bacteriocin biosynthesis protein